MRRFASSIAVVAIVIAASGPADAQTQLATWVSHTGLDSNVNVVPPCSMLQPCRSFNTANTAATIGGAVYCLDNGDFGLLTISSSVTIDCSGQGGTINVSGALNGIVINGAANVTTVVKLRGLIINGNGSTGHGVLIQNAAEVIIENCVIQNFGGAGIFAQTSNPLQLHVADTLIADNAQTNVAAGIFMIPNGSATTNFAFERIRVENNANGGIQVFPNQVTGAVTGIIRDSVVTGNPPYGIDVTTAGAPVTVSLDHTHVSGNGFGIIADGAAVILNNSTVQENNTGLSANANGAIFSYGNNAINGNQPGGTGTAPISIGLH
jgi:hypothetical protein